MRFPTITLYTVSRCCLLSIFCDALNCIDPSPTVGTVASFIHSVIVSVPSHVVTGQCSIHDTQRRRSDLPTNHYSSAHSDVCPCDHTIAVFLSMSKRKGVTSESDIA